MKLGCDTVSQIFGRLVSILLEIVCFLKFQFGCGLEYCESKINFRN